MIVTVAALERKADVLQHEMVSRIERITRLRLIFTAHLAFYGVMLLGYALIAVFSPADWHMAALVLLTWSPLMLVHTAVQTLYEARQRCATEYQFAPVKAVSPQMLPVDLYDEQGNLLRSGEAFTFTLPRG